MNRTPLPGDPVQPGIPGHEITVPPMAGIPPWCSCGVVGGNGIDKPLLADHIAEIKRAAAQVRTWTFFGHWDEDTIVVEYALEGEHEDHRIDMGLWPQGLWAASGSGDTLAQAQAATIAEYMDDELEDAE